MNYVGCASPFKIEYGTETDVLIIGSGGAGIKAAIKAAEQGAQVLLVGKFTFGRTGATFYPGTPGWGMQAVIHEGDTVDTFYEEILEAGAGMADPLLARILAEKSTEAFHELESYGLQFERHEDGRYKGVIPCFGKRLRGSSTLGMDRIRKALWLQVQKRAVLLRQRVSVIALIKKDDRICGAVALDEQDELFYIAAKAIVLATGGACDLYQYALATPDETGDGYAMALQIGASLINIEFIQFIPGLVWPVKKKLFQEKNLDTLPVFTNRFGEDVIRKYLPSTYTVEQCLTERAKHGPFTTSDVSFYVDVALYEEAIRGHTLPSGGIHVQYGKQVLADDRWFIKNWLSWMQNMGVKPVEEGFDIIPHAQCFNGGIAIDEKTNTGIAGLYAAGEAAGGAHGADRLGGAAIAATQVFGSIAGAESAIFAAQQKTIVPLSDRDLKKALEEQFDRAGGGLINIQEAMAEVRRIMWQCGAIVRSEDRCKEGLARIAAIESAFNPIRHYENRTAIRHVAALNSMILTSKAILTAIQERRESRGPHYREDYPFPQQAYENRIRLHKEGPRLITEKYPVQ